MICFDKFIAVNGTQKPIDDNYGIPKTAYDLTVENFNENSCAKFIKKISPELDLKEYTNRSAEELKEELISIRDLKPSKYLSCDKAIISTKDRIIPYKNQLNFRQENGIETIELDAPRYIFKSYKKRAELL